MFDPIPPPKITKILRGRGWLKVEWEPSPDPRVQEYRVYRTVDGGDLRYVGTVPASMTYYTDHDIAMGCKYGYRVTACCDTRSVGPTA